MDDITRQLIIEIKYQREMREMAAAQKDAAELAKKHREAAAAAKQLGRNIEGAADKVLGLVKMGALIGGAAAGGLAWGFIQSARGAQETRLALTTLVQSADSMVNGPFAGVNDAFEYSADLIKRMREEAIATPATFEDIKNSFRDVAVQARLAGAQYQDIIKLSGNMSTLNKVLGFDEGIVSKDVQQLLRGEIGEINTPQLKAIRMQVQELYKAGKSAEQLKLIMDSLRIPEELRVMFENSFEGRLSTLQDEWAMFREEAGKPILDYLTAELKTALKWIGDNREAVKGWARDIGEGVVDAIKAVRKALEWIIANRDAIIEWAKILVGAALLVKAVSLVGALKDGLQGLTAMAPGLGAALGSALGPILALAGVLKALEPYLGGGGALGKQDLDRLTNSKIDVGDAGRDILARGVERRKRAAEIAQSMGDREAYLAAYADNVKVRDDADWLFNQLRFDPDMVTTATGRSLAAQVREMRQQAMTPELVADARLALLARDPNQTSVDMSLLSDAVARGLTNPAVTPETKIDARGAKITINQRVENTNPAALARASLIDGFVGVTNKIIQPRHRPGSVRLGNGSG